MTWVDHHRVLHMFFADAQTLSSSYTGVSDAFNRDVSDALNREMRLMPSQQPWLVCSVVQVQQE